MPSRWKTSGLSGSRRARRGCSVSHDARALAATPQFGQGVANADPKFAVTRVFGPERGEQCVYIRELGVTEVGDIAIWTGVTLGVSPAIAALAGPLWGRVGDRFGNKLLVQRSLVSFMLVMIAMAYVTRPWHLLALRVLQGFFAGYGALNVSMAALSAPAPPRRLQDIESDTGYDTRRRWPDGALARMSQTTGCGTTCCKSHRDRGAASEKAPRCWTPVGVDRPL